MAKIDKDLASTGTREGGVPSSLVATLQKSGESMFAASHNLNVSIGADISEKLVAEDERKSAFSNYLTPPTATSPSSTEPSFPRLFQHHSRLQREFTLPGQPLP